MKVTVALLEAHRGFQQDQDREEANSAFLGLIDRGTSLPWKEHRTYETSPAKGQSLPAAASWVKPHMRIASHDFIISGQRRLNWPVNRPNRISRAAATRKAESCCCQGRLSYTICFGKLVFAVTNSNSSLSRFILQNCSVISVPWPRRRLSLRRRGENQAADSARVLALKSQLAVGQGNTPQFQHARPQLQGSPLRERLPSTIRTGIAARAANGSAQRSCHKAFRVSPKSVIAAR